MKARAPGAFSPAPRVLIVTGATATGKTGLAIDLARRLPVDIISADAAQVYRGMDIGTAKPDAETLKCFPHRLVDIRDPEDVYSAADFCRDARAAIEDSLAQGRLPLVVGGTMFYLSALVNGLSELPEANDVVRGEILACAAREGWPALHRQLAAIDPVLASRIRPGDAQRLQRAHEIYRVTGRSPSAVMRARRPEPLSYPFLSVALFHPDRRVLHRRISMRFHGMLEQGFVDEVESLRRRPGLSRRSPSMRTVGYRQALEYLEDDTPYRQFVDAAVAATRQLAKRQLTWLRGTPGTVWMDASRPDVLDNLLKYIASRSPGAPGPRVDASLVTEA
jgi:tRNA dimethylallyltransferase